MTGVDVSRLRLDAPDPMPAEVEAALRRVLDADASIAQVRVDRRGRRLWVTWVPRRGDAHVERRAVERLADEAFAVAVEHAPGGRHPRWWVSGPRAGVAE